VAVGTVNREPVSPPKSLIYRENTGNSRETGFQVGQILQSGPFSGAYAACFPEFGNREISADEQGIPRCGTPNAIELEMSFNHVCSLRPNAQCPCLSLFMFSEAGCHA
jgi:hypothetical protein